MFSESGYNREGRRRRSTTLERNLQREQAGRQGPPYQPPKPKGTPSGQSKGRPGPKQAKQPPNSQNRARNRRKTGTEQEQEKKGETPSTKPKPPRGRETTTGAHTTERRHPRTNTSQTGPREHRQRLPDRHARTPIQVPRALTQQQSRPATTQEPPQAHDHVQSRTHQPAAKQVTGPPQAGAHRQQRTDHHNKADQLPHGNHRRRTAKRRHTRTNTPPNRVSTLEGLRPERPQQLRVRARRDLQQLRHQVPWAHGRATVSHPFPLPGADVPTEGPQDQSAPCSATTAHRVLSTHIPQRLLQDRLKGSAGAGGLIVISQQGHRDVRRGHDGPVVALATTHIRGRAHRSRPSATDGLAATTSGRASCSQRAARTPSSAAVR